MTSDVKVKKIGEDVWEATHAPTKLNICSHSKLMAVFKLGMLVERQMVLKFENSIAESAGL